MRTNYPRGEGLSAQADVPLVALQMTPASVAPAQAVLLYETLMPLPHVILFQCSQAAHLAQTPHCCTSMAKCWGKMGKGDLHVGLL